MNSLTIPPSPNWYEASILACSPENTLIYGSRNDLVVIKNPEANEAAYVRIISRAHSQKILSVSLNKNWGQPNKFAVTVSEDKIVKIWNVETLKKHSFHKEHLKHGKVIGASFAGDERVISVTEDGIIVVWNIGANQTTVIKDLFAAKVTVTCISTCPHATWLTAFGLKNGLVVVTDLRKNGKVLYKLRGHEKSVVSLSWCPVPINIFPKYPLNHVGPRKQPVEREVEVPDDPTPQLTNEETNNTSISSVNQAADDAEQEESPQALLKASLEGKSEESKTETIEELIDGSGEASENIKEEGNEVIEEKEQLETRKEDDKSVEVESEVTLAEDVADSKIDENNIKIDVEEEELPRKEFLLASSAKEGNIYIWRAGTDGRMQTFMMIPNSSHHNRKSKSPDKIWITLCWIAPTVLLSSSKSSELLHWTLPKPKDKSKQATVVHKDHSSLLFAIAAPNALYNEFNWLEKRELNAWTVGQDRLLLNTSLNSEKTNLACYPTFGGNVTCLELSPLDPNRLAIGTGDGFVKIWDMSRPHTRQIVMTNFYQKIQSKVMALSWHPDNESLLAFGTAEGRVGCLDTTNKSKSPVVLKHFFKTQIYKMEWAPVSGNKKEFVLYVVAEGKIVLFDASKPEEEPVEVDKPDNTFIYSFAWKRDYSMMLATTKSGFIIVYTADLKIMCKHYFQERLQEIYWHPDSSAGGDSKQAKWFASTTNLKTLLVYDFDVTCENNDNKVVGKYEGIGDLITSISWSPYEAGQMVIASESGIAQIWDVEQNKIISTYSNPNYDGISRAIWSPVDPDCMISGGKDYTLRVWKISENPPKDSNDILTARKGVLKEISAESADPSRKTEPPSEESLKVKKTNKCVLLPNFYPKRSTSQIVDDMKKLLVWRDSPQSDIGDRSEPDILDIFGAKEDMLKLITLNETIHKQKGKYNMNAILSLLRGDISTSIKEAIQEKRVTPWIISLAPMVSPKLWQTACETYARQLSEEPEADPLEIATYFLACHKLDEAIGCLCGAAMYREALALAKCRLPDNDEAIKEIIDKWAKYSVMVGNFEIAAECYIFLGRYEEAATVLFRRSDMDIMEFAVQLAAKCNNEELHKAVLFRYNAFKKKDDDEDKEEEDALPAMTTKAEAVLQIMDKDVGAESVEEQAVATPATSSGSNIEEDVKDSSTDTAESFGDAVDCDCEDSSDAQVAS